MLFFQQSKTSIHKAFRGGKKRIPISDDEDSDLVAGRGLYLKHPTTKNLYVTIFTR